MHNLGLLPGCAAGALVNSAGDLRKDDGVSLVVVGEHSAPLFVYGVHHFVFVCIAPADGEELELGWRDDEWLHGQ